MVDGVSGGVHCCATSEVPGWVFFQFQDTGQAVLLPALEPGGELTVRNVRFVFHVCNLRGVPCVVKDRRVWFVLRESVGLKLHEGDGIVSRWLEGGFPNLLQA